MSPLKSVAAATAAIMFAGTASTAIAQSHYGLVGQNAASVDSQLRREGYASGNGGEGARNSRYVYWLRGDDCIQVLTRDGTVRSIIPAAMNYCNGIRSSSSSSDGAAVVAGVAIIGLAAALAAHNSHHNDADRDHDREYQRGYQAAINGDDYDARRETEGYHEGFLAGEDESRNRQHSNSSWVRGAPGPAQEACSRRADDFMSRPAGSSVPISVRDLGRGEYELTMATGSYRSRCTVSASGNVRSIDPY